MHIIQIYVLAAIFILLVISPACKPKTQSHEADQIHTQHVSLTSDRENREALTARQKAATIRELEALRNTSAENFRDNENRILEMKAKMNRINSLDRTNRNLKASIESFEPGMVDWELFKRAFNYDMKALENELNDISGYAKK